MSYQNEQSTFQTSDNLKLFCQRWIPSSVSNAKPGNKVLVIHHGLGEHSDRYSNILSILEGTGITVYSYDVRGHGRSEGRKGLAKDLSHLADDLDTFLQFIQKAYKITQKPMLYGHSMGGAVVLTFLSKSKANQDRVKAVVATASALGVEKNCYQAFMSSLLSCLRAVVPNTTLPSGLDVSKLSRDQNVVEAFKSDDMTHDMISIGLAFSLLESGRADIIPTASNMTLPIFLAHGEKDVITDPKATQEYFDACGSKDKTIKMYPNLMHEIHNELKEDKEKVLADLKDFITAHM